MIFQVKSYDLQDVLSYCQPDDNLDNILFQLNNRTVWIVDRPLKHGDVFEVTDPVLIRDFMREIGGFVVYVGISTESDIPLITEDNNVIFAD